MTGDDPRRLDEPGGPLLDTFGASDGYRFYYRRYVPDCPPRSCVVFLHGIQSHGGWYTKTCAALRDAGHEVFFLDRRGSGLNTARRGDAPSFRRLIDDVAEFLQFLPAGRPGVPVPRRLAAISWGGKLATGLQYRAPGLIDGMALICPGLAAKVRPPLPTRLKILRARVRKPTKFFPVPLSDPALFTASPIWQHFIAHDRFGLREATARLLVESAALGPYLKRAARHVRVPTLLMLAGQDRIIDNAKAEQCAGRFPGGLTVVQYEKAHHTLEFDSAADRHRADLLRWAEGQ